MNMTSDGDTARGFGLALAAYLIWGALPLYLKLVQHIALPEVLAHRIVWSVPIALVILVLLRRTRDLVHALRTPRLLAMAGISACLVTVNWSVYLYAILTDQALSAALGYYINPLFSIFLAALVLREKLSAAQWAAVALAAASVGLLTWEAGSLPLIALTLTASWGLYALAKRALPIGPNQGFTLEVMLLSPVALGYLVWLQAQGQMVFGHTGPGDIALLLGCGVLTAVPLMLYANGAKGLRLSTIALMQFIVPTAIFAIAVLIFDEPFAGARRIAFPMIWGALLLYAADVLRRRR